jgi:hypothetical protein
MLLEWETRNSYRESSWETFTWKTLKEDSKENIKSYLREIVYKDCR